MIDVSDGLSSDLFHTVRMSGVAAELDQDKLPIDPDVIAQFGAKGALEFALDGGEDYGLLFTVREADHGKLNDLPVTAIGRTTSGDPGISIRSPGEIRPLSPKGFKHF